MPAAEARCRPQAKFCSECGRPSKAVTAPRFASPKSYTPQHLADKILTTKDALEGERKQVTVLFADIKGSMEIFADRDPEDAQKLLDPVLERMIEAVHRYEGTVNRVMGDGIMALFGAPLAHEDHAVRACYAALRMQETVTRYADEVQRSYGVPVTIRVGLNSGEIVVRAIGNDLHMDYTVVGQTANLAARMEQMAKPGSVLTTADTLRLAEGYVAMRPLGGPVPVKGLADPVQIYEVTGVGAARTRLQVSAGRGLTRFVGRDVELEQLLARSSLPTKVEARWWRSSAKRGWASRAWCTSSFIRTIRRTGWFWNPIQFPTVAQRPICRSSNCSRIISRSTSKTARDLIREKVTRGF